MKKDELELESMTVCANDAVASHQAPTYLPSYLGLELERRSSFDQSSNDKN